MVSSCVISVIWYGRFRSISIDFDPSVQSPHWEDTTLALEVEEEQEQEEQQPSWSLCRTNGPKKDKKKSVVLLSRHPCWGVEYCDSTHIILNILESVCSWQLSPIVVLMFKQTLNMPGKRRSGSFLFPINLSATIWSYLSSCNRSKVLTSASTSTWMPCQTCNKS